VIERHPRPITVIAGHLKSRATRELTARALHPLSGFTGDRGGLPTPWSEGSWKVFLDTADQIHVATTYVERHPGKEGLADQRWSFVENHVAETVAALSHI
jgi:hypothetical protein